VQFLQRKSLTAFETGLAPGLVNEDAPHGLGGRSEEMGASAPVLTIRTCEFQPCFMHQRSGLQGLARRFMGHLLRREFAQFLINQWQQFVRGSGIAMCQRIENVRHVSQSEDGYRKYPCWQCNGQFLSSHCPPRLVCREAGRRASTSEKEFLKGANACHFIPHSNVQNACFITQSRPHAELQAAIEEFLRAWNENPRPFVWTATVQNIMDKINRGRAALEMIQPGGRKRKNEKNGEN
jgi:hypothetical protein